MWFGIHMKLENCCILNNIQKTRAIMKIVIKNDFQSNNGLVNLETSPGDWRIQDFTEEGALSTKMWVPAYYFGKSQRRSRLLWLNQSVRQKDDRKCWPEVYIGDAVWKFLPEVVTGSVASLVKYITLRTLPVRKWMWTRDIFDSCLDKMIRLQ